MVGKFSNGGSDSGRDQMMSKLMFIAGFVFFALDILSLGTTFSFIQTRLYPISPSNARFNYYNKTSQSTVYFNTTGNPNLYVVDSSICLPMSPDRIKDNFRLNMWFAGAFFLVSSVLTILYTAYASFYIAGRGVYQCTDGEGNSTCKLYMANPWFVQLRQLYAGKGWMSEGDSDRLQKLDLNYQALTGYFSYAQLFFLAAFILMCSPNSSFVDQLSLLNYCASVASIIRKIPKIASVTVNFAGCCCFCFGKKGRYVEVFIGIMICLAIMVMPIVSFFTYVPF
ncbi:hypothetical protein MP228_002371 [Amoeboaphelidium protococcarum]|nr:hypothetical protein MP228_002371 [Amoeboaphelidium protococcarum]